MTSRDEEDSKGDDRPAGNADEDSEAIVKMGNCKIRAEGERQVGGERLHP